MFFFGFSIRTKLKIHKSALRTMMLRYFMQKVREKKTYFSIDERKQNYYRPGSGAEHTQFNTLCSSFITCSISSDFMGGLAYWPESSPCPSLALSRKNKVTAFHQPSQLFACERATLKWHEQHSKSARQFQYVFALY